MTDDIPRRPRAVAKDERWPLLAAIIERSYDRYRFTFALSDIAPETHQGTVVLGIDHLKTTDGTNASISVRFAGMPSVHTRIGATEQKHADVEVEFCEGAVSFLLPAPHLIWADVGPAAFCTISDVQFQTNVPVLVLVG